MITNKFRLQSNTYDRTQSDKKVKPRKIYFLSVEGNKAEVKYFQGINDNLKAIGINSFVHVEVLKRNNHDTNSSPNDVIELLEEYLRLRSENEEEQINNIKRILPKNFLIKYNDLFIKQYIEDDSQLDKKKKNEFSIDLLHLGIDLNYRKYLKKYSNDIDEFCIVIDKDKRNHSVQMLSECLDKCKRKGYGFYITNPCFEFWLLMHLVDIKKVYSNDLDAILDNKPISNNHTFVSNLLSENTHMGKNVIKFESTYLNNINKAIEQSKEFETNPEKLIHDKLGTNIGILLSKIINEDKFY